MIVLLTYLLRYLLGYLFCKVVLRFASFLLFWKMSHVQQLNDPFFFLLLTLESLSLRTISISLIYF
jgi:hypothetical protein